MLKSYSTNYNVEGNNTWTQSVDFSANDISLNSIAMSSSGQYLSACCPSGVIFNSNNYGVDWVSARSLNTGPVDKYWTSIASSSSGQYLAACSDGILIYTSTNYGMDWIYQPLLDSSGNFLMNNIVEIVSSSSGQYLAACTSTSLIWLSDSYGAVWTLPTLPNTTNQSLTSITISSSGQYLASCSVYNVIDPSSGYILRSIDFGLNWQILFDNLHSWTSITSSSSGQYLAASFYDASGGVYTSEDYGESWVYQSNSPTNVQISSIASSGSGQTLALCTLDVSAGVYISNNYGIDWNQINTLLPDNSDWVDIAISTSGQYLAVCSNNGKGVYNYSSDVDIGTTFGSMIEELQISQNNNSIYPSPYFSWSIFTNPTPATITTPLPVGYCISSGTLTGALQGGANYYQLSTNVPPIPPEAYGVKLIDSGSTSGAIYWDLPEFDYNNNFEIIISVFNYYLSNPNTGGQLSIGLGCPLIPTPVPLTPLNPDGSEPSQYSQPSQLGLWCVYDNQQNNNFFYQSGILSGLKQSNIYMPGFQPGFATITMRVITIGINRIASTYFNGVLRNSVILQPGFYAGRYLIVAGSAGGYGNIYTCNCIEINYI
jgi:photosystem II stability/assembly factor-like uncharacterized protein